MRDIWRVNLAVLAHSFGSLSLAPILSPYAKWIGVSVEQVGFVVSAAFISSIASRLFAGPLSDRVGRMRVMRVGLALSVLASLLYILSNDLQTLVSARVIHGVGMALFLPASIATAFDVEGRAQEVLAWRSAMYGIGSSVGPILGSAVADAFGYRTAFVISALSYAIGLAIVVGCRIREQTDRRGDRVRFGGKLAEAFLVRMLTAMSYWVVTAYIPVYLTEIGQPLSVMGSFLTISSIISIVTRVLSKGVRDIGGMAFGNAAISSLSLTIVTLTLEPDLLIVLSPVFGASIGFMIPLLQFYAISEAPPSARGFAASVYTVAWDLGALSGPTLAGILIGYSHDYRSLTYLIVPSVVVPAALAALRSSRTSMGLFHRH